MKFLREIFKILELHVLFVLHPVFVLSKGLLFYVITSYFLNTIIKELFWYLLKMMRAISQSQRTLSS